MSQHRWQIGIVALGIAALFLAAGCTSTDFIDSGNSIVSFELVAVGAGSQPFDCVQWGLGELKLRPLDGSCGADSVNAGDPCLSTTDCVPLPGETGTCLNSEADELIGDDGILVPASPEPGHILGGDCEPTLDAGGVCEGLFAGPEQVRCDDSSDCGFCDQSLLPCEVDDDCFGANDECNQQAPCVNPSRVVATAFVPPEPLILSAGLYEISTISTGEAMLYVDVPVPELVPPGPFFRGCREIAPVVDSFGESLRFTVLPDQDKVVRFTVNIGELEQNLPAEDDCTNFQANITDILDCDTCNAAP